LFFLLLLFHLIIFDQQASQLIPFIIVIMIILPYLLLILHGYCIQKASPKRSHRLIAVRLWDLTITLMDLRDIIPKPTFLIQKSNFLHVAMLKILSCTMIQS
jgi:hypothetical protein